MRGRETLFSLNDAEYGTTYFCKIAACGIPAYDDDARLAVSASWSLAWIGVRPIGWPEEDSKLSSSQSEGNSFLTKEHE